MSPCPMATRAAYTTLTTARVTTTGAAHRAASGNSGRQSRIMPKVPTLSSTPTSKVFVPGVPAAAASGSQVWKGTIGAFTAKAKKKATNSHL